MGGRRPKIRRAVALAVLARQRWCCAVCREALTDVWDMDHVVPRALRPCDDADALQALCVACHARKSRGDEARLIAEHKTPGQRVCWTCYRVVRLADEAYDDARLCCTACAPSLAATSATTRALDELDAYKCRVVLPPF